MTSSPSNLEKFQDYLETKLLANIFPPPNSSNSLHSRCKKPRKPVLQQKTKFCKGTYENVINSPDGRKQVHRTSQWPYNVHGLIEGKFNDYNFKGTGILIGPNIVLTAGHNLYYFTQNVFADLGTLRFKPGMNGKSLPFGEIKVEKYFVSPDYIKEEKDDYGILILKEPIGDITGYFGLACSCPNKIPTKRIKIIGYPEDKVQSNSMWEMEGSIQEIDEKENFMSYDIDTAKGQSGSGVFYQENGKYYICGVHVRGGGQNVNMATLLTPKIYEQIYQWIQENVRKEHLLYLKKHGDFGGYKLNAGCIELLFKYNFENLGSLDFRFERIQAEGAKLLAKNSSWVHLTHLYLSENNVGHEGAEALASNTSWNNLLKLDLTGNNLGDKGVKALAKNISWINLSELYLRFNNISDEGAKALGQNTSWKKLSQLSLSENNLGNEGVKALAQNTTWTKLSKLGLNWNKIGDEGAQALAKNLSWKNLSQLDLFKNNIGDDGAKGLAENSSWSSLSTLDISENKIGDKGAKGLGENTSWFKLARLYLSENKIGDEGASALAKNVSWKELTHLHLRYNRIGDKGAKGLGKNTTWTKLLRLYLTENQVSNEGAKALAKNTSWMKIAEMDLAKNKISDEGTKALAKNSSWISLLQLDLSENKIGDEGAKAIAENSAWINLSQLILNCNNIGDAGVKSLASTKISQLQLSWNPISSEGARILFAKPDFYWIPSEGNICQVFSIWNAVENSRRFWPIKINLQELYQLLLKGKISLRQFQRFIQSNLYVIHAPLDFNSPLKEDHDSIEESSLAIGNENLIDKEDVSRQSQSYSDLNPNSNSFNAEGVQFPLENIYMNTQSLYESKNES